VDDDRAYLLTNQFLLKSVNCQDLHLNKSGSRTHIAETTYFKIDKCLQDPEIFLQHQTFLHGTQAILATSPIQEIILCLTSLKKFT
jgi:hypothetical protein